MEHGARNSLESTGVLYGWLPGQTGKLLAVILFICSIFLIRTGTPALAEDAYYADLKDKLSFAFYDSDFHCQVKGKSSATTGDIVIPSTVTVRKGDGVSLPSGVDERTYMVTEVANFQGTALTSIQFPETLQRIAASAFLNCTTLSGNLTVPDSVTIIEGRAFEGCTGLTGTLTLGTGLTTISASAFKNCGFTGTLVIPENVETIYNYAFSGCRGFTGDLTIPENVTMIYNQAFKDCSGFNGTLRLLCKNATRQGETFRGCSGFMGLEIGEGVTSIANYEFYGCSGMTGTLVIPDSVTSFGTYAFGSCSGFTGTLTIPSVMTEIGYSAFRDCSGFTSLALPSGLTTIQSNAFDGCTGMTGALTLPDSIQTVGDSAFRNCGFTGSLTLPEGLSSFNSSSFACPGITGTLTIPSSITGTTMANAFTGMLQVRKILNHSTAKIQLAGNFIDQNDEESFFVQSGTTEHLKAYTVSTTGAKVYTMVGQGVYFRNGEETERFGPADFVLPADVTVIQDEAFAGIKASVVDIPDTCTQIGARAFKDCLSLTQIRIPENCEIGEDVFENCVFVTIFGKVGSPADTYCKSHDNCALVEE